MSLTKTRRLLRLKLRWLSILTLIQTQWIRLHEEKPRWTASENPSEAKIRWASAGSICTSFVCTRMHSGPYRHQQIVTSQFHLLYKQNWQSRRVTNLENEAREISNTKQWYMWFMYRGTVWLYCNIISNIIMSFTIIHNHFIHACTPFNAVIVNNKDYINTRMSEITWLPNLL